MVVKFFKADIKIIINTVIFLLSFLLVESIFADGLLGAKDVAKKISFADNAQIRVVLSNRDVNRVLVRGDKIQGINGPSSLYVAKNDASGSVYINVYGDAAFTVFGSTVNGHNFSLLVTPKIVAGKTIILEPTTPILLTKRFEEAEGYQKVLVQLIKGMLNQEVFEDYSYSRIEKPQEAQAVGGIRKTDFYGVADITPIAAYSGSRLLGVVFRVRNKTKKPITLKASFFYKPGVRAVALSHQTIAPLAVGLLYQVVGRVD